MYDLIYTDDDSDDLEIAQMAFENIGWARHVLLLPSAKKTLQYLEQLTNPLHFPHLLLLDYDLGEMNAEDLLVVLRSNPHYNYLHVVIFSTDLPPGIKNRLYELGAKCCVDKPTSLEKYTMLVARLKRISGELAIGLEPSFNLLEQ